MKIMWKTFLAVSAYWAGCLWMVLYRSLAGVEKTGAFRDTGTDCRTSFDRTFDRRIHTGIFVSVPGRWYLVCRLYDQ